MWEAVAGQRLMDQRQMHSGRPPQAQVGATCSVSCGLVLQNAAQREKQGSLKNMSLFPTRIGYMESLPR